MKTEKEIIEEIKRHKLNIERTNIDIKKEAHQRMVELLEAELKGIQSQKQKFIEEIEKLREPLADLEHQQWMEWSKNICNNERISEDRLDKWAHLWKDYKKLSQEQKEKDRIWADKVIELLKVIGEK